MQMSIYEFKDHIKNLPEAERESVLQRARIRIENPKIGACEGCHQIPLIKWRRSRRYCNNACKQKAWRSRQHETNLGKAKL